MASCRDGARGSPIRYAGMKILWLGYEDSPLIDFLHDDGHDVTATSEKVTAASVEDESFDWLISYGYRHILRSKLLSLFGPRAINLHISYLPYNRGADPNLWSWVDDTPKGVTIHQLDAGIDTGPIYAQRKVDLPETATLASSYEALQDAIQVLFRDIWPDLCQGEMKPMTQPAAGTSHLARDKEPLVPLLTDGWQTPVSVLIEHGRTQRARG